MAAPNLLGCLYFTFPSPSFSLHNLVSPVKWILLLPHSKGTPLLPSVATYAIFLKWECPDVLLTLSRFPT